MSIEPTEAMEFDIFGHKVRFTPQGNEDNSLHCLAKESWYLCWEPTDFGRIISLKFSRVKLTDYSNCHRNKIIFIKI